MERAKDEKLAQMLAASAQKLKTVSEEPSVLEEDDEIDATKIRKK